MRLQDDKTAAEIVAQKACDHFSKLASLCTRTEGAMELGALAARSRLFIPADAYFMEKSAEWARTKTAAIPLPLIGAGAGAVTGGLIGGLTGGPGLTTSERLQRAGLGAGAGGLVGAGAGYVPGLLRNRVVARIGQRKGALGVDHAIIAKGRSQRIEHLKNIEETLGDLAAQNEREALESAGPVKSFEEFMKVHVPEIKKKVKFKNELLAQRASSKQRLKDLEIEDKMINMDLGDLAAQEAKVNKVTPYIAGGAGALTGLAGGAVAAQAVNPSLEEREDRLDAALGKFKAASIEGMVYTPLLRATEMRGKSLGKNIGTRYAKIKTRRHIKGQLAEVGDGAVDLLEKAASKILDGASWDDLTEMEKVALGGGGLAKAWGGIKSFFKGAPKVVGGAPKLPVPVANPNLSVPRTVGFKGKTPAIAGGRPPVQAPAPTGAPARMSTEMWNKPSPALNQAAPPAGPYRTPGAQAPGGKFHMTEQGTSRLQGATKDLPTEIKKPWLTFGRKAAIAGTGLAIGGTYLGGKALDVGRAALTPQPPGTAYQYGGGQMPSYLQ